MKNVLLFILLIITNICYANEKIVLILDWLPNPNHAPIFIAQDKGFFQDEKLDVEIISPSNPVDPPKWVAAKKADIAITYQPQFVMQVNQDLPLLNIGTLVDKPLDCLTVLESSSIKKISDLKNKSIGSSTNGVSGVLLKTMLKQHGLTLNDIEAINVHFDLTQALLSKKIDAVTGMMRNVEVVQLQQMRQPVRIFLPEENGVPMYSELIYVAHPDFVQDPKFAKFLRALTKATSYIKNNPDQAWELFAKKHPMMNNQTNHAIWLATIPYFADYPSHFNTENWQKFLVFMHQNKMIKTIKPQNSYTIDLLKE